jgi:hypothetical protein
MNEYQEHLNEYKSEYYFTYSRLSENEWGNIKIAKAYLQKYWLSENEYKNFWLPIQRNIFNEHSNGLPSFMFCDGFQVFPLIGGVLFTKADFEALQSCMNTFGDTYFFVIQNSFEQIGSSLVPNFRMKYPANITWDELMGGNFISTVLFEMPHNDYFVFGSKGLWGKYVANDFDTPLDLIGVKSKYAPIFENKFPLSEEEKEVIKKVLPQEYIIKNIL